MKSRKGLDENHWEVLKKAYLGNRQERIIPGWQTEVMRKIRGLAAEKAKPKSFWADKLVWRFASAACLLAVILALLAANIGIKPELNWVQLLIGDPPGPTHRSVWSGPRERRSGLKQWKILSALSLIFLAGLVTGAVVTGLYDKHRYESLHQGEYPAAIRKVVMETLARELSLNTGQRREIEAIVKETQAGLKELRMRYGPEAEIAIPDSVTYAPVDFEKQTLGDGLRRAGFKKEEPAFFSMLGVVIYLTKSAVSENTPIRRLSAFRKRNGVRLQCLALPAPLRTSDPPTRAPPGGSRRLENRGSPTWILPPSLSNSGKWDSRRLRISVRRKPTGVTSRIGRTAFRSAVPAVC